MNESLGDILSRRPFVCECGKTHSAHLKEAEICPGVTEKLAGYVKKYNGTKVYAVADENTMRAAGEKALRVLRGAGIPYVSLLITGERAEPDEKAIGTLIYNFDYTCDIIVGIGTGVINDLCKILAKLTGLPYIIVATAPSMDGFASSTSSIIRGGLKVSVDSKCPDVIIADTDVLCSAPQEMICAGFGDMIAKYVSICEWRIGHIVTGEYYCGQVADMMRTAVRRIAENAEGLAKRDVKAITAVTEGLILSGVAADYAGVSRPASGVEHYYSHLWDMRHLEFGTPWSLHGIQCGIGTLLALGKYAEFVKIVPEGDLAEKRFSELDTEKIKAEITDYLGESGNSINATLASADRYDAEKHRERLANITEHFGEILEIIREELPERAELEKLFALTGSPVKPSDIGIPDSEADRTFRLTKDIRDKYILSTMMSDLGIL